MRSGRLPEDDWDRRSVIVRGFDRRINRRQIYVDLVDVSGRAVVMVVAISGASVDVHHCGFGVEAEEGQTKKDRDRPHRDKST